MSSPKILAFMVTIAAIGLLAAGKPSLWAASSQKDSHDPSQHASATQEPQSKDQAAGHGSAVSLQGKASLDVDAPSKVAIAALRKAFGRIDQLIYLYSALPKDGLIVLSYPGKLLVDPDETTLKSLLADERPTVDINVTPAIVNGLLQQGEQPALPVYDDRQQLVGIVAVDKVMDAIRKRAVVGAAPASRAAAAEGAPSAEDTHGETTPDSHAQDAAQSPADQASGQATQEAAAHQTAAVNTHGAAPAETHSSAPVKDSHAAAQPAIPLAKGVAFIEAAIKPLQYELDDRFWGWRPNDILTFTDNVNNFQLGVLEVTRRTAMVLAERVSRTGITASFDPSLENAMNWFMIKWDRFWFPSAESKYQAGLDGFKEYRQRLEKGEANFYNRADNLIPLLMAYEDLLGSSEENLVKATEEDGEPVSYFKADDYVFYAKGVVSALSTILEAIEIDFNQIIHSRRAEGDLHHAIESCHHVLEIDPILVTNSDPSSLLANHRANLAAPLSHARFYLGVLIKTLST